MPHGDFAGVLLREGTKITGLAHHIVETIYPFSTDIMHRRGAGSRINRNWSNADTYLSCRTLCPGACERGCASPFVILATETACLVVVAEGTPSAATSTPPQISFHLSLDGGRRFLPHLELPSNLLEKNNSGWVRCTVIIRRRARYDVSTRACHARPHSTSENLRSLFEKHRRQLAVPRGNWRSSSQDATFASPKLFNAFL